MLLGVSGCQHSASASVECVIVTIERLFDQSASGPGLALTADVLVLGGGPAGAWAALLAAGRGAKVILVEKGFLGTGGATAAGNTTTIHTVPGLG